MRISADQLVPALHRALTGDEVSAGALTVIGDLEEEAVLLGFEGEIELILHRQFFCCKLLPAHSCWLALGNFERYLK